MAESATIDIRTADEQASGDLLAQFFQQRGPLVAGVHTGTETSSYQFGSAT